MLSVVGFIEQESWAYASYRCEEVFSPRFGRRAFPVAVSWDSVMEPARFGFKSISDTIEPPEIEMNALEFRQLGDRARNGNLGIFYKRGRL